MTCYILRTYVIYLYIYVFIPNKIFSKSNLAFLINPYIYMDTIFLFDILIDNALP